MIKIGLLGTDSTHGLGFAKMLNCKDAKTGKYLYGDVRMTHVYGHDITRTSIVAADGFIDKIVQDPQEMLGQVDAVMIVFRDSSLHKKYALPFLKAGIPVFVDKPFTDNVADAKAIIKAAKSGLLTGGSSLRASAEADVARFHVGEDPYFGEVHSAYISGSADINFRPGGLHFYGSHIAEMVCYIFGYDIQSVYASENNGEVTAIAKYPKFDVMINFTKVSHRNMFAIYGQNGTLIREFSGARGFENQLEMFIDMIKTKKPHLDPQCLLASVELMCAVYDSIKTGVPSVIKR